MPNDSDFCHFCGNSLKEDKFKAYNESIAKNDYGYEKKICSGCGSVINNGSNSCSVCGKQYFKLSAGSMLIPVLSGAFCLILIIIFCTIFYNQNQRIKALTVNVENLNNVTKNQINVINTLNNKISEKDKEINNLKSENSQLRFDSIDNVLKADFLMNYIALIADDIDSKYYHTYDCEEIKNCDGYWAYNIEAAIGKGYKPCPKCH
jgi:hypothetical protein